MYINKVVLLGYVGKDPVVRYFENGNAVANFTIATSDWHTNNKGERVVVTEWHKIVLWRKLAEYAEKYIKKGTELYIEGKLRTRSWNDKDGKTNYITEVSGENLQIGKRNDATSQSKTSNSNDILQANKSLADCTTDKKSEEIKSGNIVSEQKPDNIYADFKEADDLPF